MEFRSEKIPQNRLGMVSVIPWKSKFRGSERKEMAGTMFSSDSFGTEFREFTSIFVPRNGIPSCFPFRRKVRNRIPKVCYYFCSTEWNSELFSLPRMVLNGISRVCFYFCSMIQNSEHFSFCRPVGMEFREASVIRGIIFFRKLTTLLQLRGGPSIPIIIPLLFCLSV
jgi:hypothetical protein